MEVNLEPWMRKMKTEVDNTEQEVTSPPTCEGDIPDVAEKEFPFRYRRDGLAHSELSAPNTILPSNINEFTAQGPTPSSTCCKAGIEIM
jgi:hypothetical protein